MLKKLFFTILCSFTFLQATYPSNVVFLTLTSTLPDGSEETTTATGYVINQQGYILTNSHIIPRDEEGNYDELVIKGSLESRYAPSVPIDRINANTENDLLLLRLRTITPNMHIQTPICANSNSMNTGDRIFIFGFPLNMDLHYNHGSISSTSHRAGNWIADIVLNPGQSGSPIFNYQGEWVGVAKGAINGKGIEGLRIIIPLNHASNLLRLAGGCQEEELVTVTNNPITQIQGSIQIHPNDNKKFENMRKRIEIAIETDTSSSIEHINESQTFNIPHTNYQNIKISPSYEQNMSLLNKDFQNNYYIFSPKKIESKTILSSPKFIFRTLEWFHTMQKNKILEDISAIKFHTVETEFKKTQQYYHSIRILDKAINILPAQKLYYSFMQQMSGEFMRVVRANRRLVYRKLENIKNSRNCFKERLTLTSDEKYFQKYPNHLFQSLADWILYAKKIYLKKTYFANTIDEIDENSFTHLTSKEFLSDDVEQVINILELEYIQEKISKWIALQKFSKSKKGREKQKHLENWSERLSSIDTLNLNHLANYLHIIRNIK